jgi:hypothetical protein
MTAFSTMCAQPEVTVVDITDLTAASARMDLLEQDAMPLQSIRLQARRVIVQLRSAVSANCPWIRCGGGGRTGARHTARATGWMAAPLRYVARFKSTVAIPP